MTKKLGFFGLLIITLCCSLASINHAEAEQLDYKALDNGNIDTKLSTISIFKDINDFIRVAISESNWQDSLSDDPLYVSYGGLASDSYQQTLKKNLPKFSEYIFREKGIPPSSVINKWPIGKTITIGIGWPNFLQPYPYASRRLSDSEIPKVEKVIKDNIILIQKASGLQLEFLKVEDENNFGRLRIIFTPDFYFQNNSSKLSRKITPFTQKPLFHEHFEPLFIGAVPFTSHLQNGIDGYFLTSSSNEIKWSACYIKANQVSSALFYRVQECLIRSLGLPDSVENIEHSILSTFFPTDESQEHSLLSKDKQFLEFMYHSNISSGDNYWQIFNKLRKEH